MLTAGSLAGTPSAAPEPVRNLLGTHPAIVPSGPEIQYRQDPDGAGLSATLAPGSAPGSVSLGPASFPSGTSLLRLTAAITLTGTSVCEISAVFTAGDKAQPPTQLPFSPHAAQSNGVFQDLSIAVPPATDGVRIEFRVTPAAGSEAVLHLRYPCLTVLPVPAAPPSPSDGTLFRHSFSHPDCRADLVQGAPTPYPAWSCVQPTAPGKTGPGQLVKQPQDAAWFALPAQQVIARGTVTFWLQPIWEPGDARPGDMLKLSQGKGAILIRKNHGWSFLFVLWDGDHQSRSVSCDLKNLAQGQWTKVEAAWDAETGLRLSVNGVALATKECTWPVPPPEPVGLRLGQSEYDKPERAPYVLDEVEIRVEPMKGAL
ncbi:MAG: hypothetical protein A3K19_21825 [Lentisphaerae bacterium RIFOXYB12_FULL_65_16]|nr:MAG: hypothetical protein A3K18_04425 [Lentisphaerae bacterium RIFOXYA12_64_32]OGV93897.1 MAG: hypothetical protein A3K19_21825 [Lentisphaerae bacterium RIFOXYB12_FULL_65_16]